MRAGRAARALIAASDACLAAERALVALVARRERHRLGALRVEDDVEDAGRRQRRRAVDARITVQRCRPAVRRIGSTRLALVGTEVAEEVRHAEVARRVGAIRVRRAIVTSAQIAR